MRRGRSKQLISADQQYPRREVNLTTAVGVLLILIALSALATYAALILPGRIAAAGGPPEEFRAAATRQRESTPGTLLSVDSGDTGTATPTSYAAARTNDTEAPSVPTLTPTTNPRGEWPLPNYVDVTYWLSIPNIGLEAPIIALEPRIREYEGRFTRRLPVPNSYSIAWDSTSAEPGFVGNTIMTGHNNLYGGVLQNLQDVQLGWEIAIWSEYGVLSFYVTDIIYLEEDDQPLEVRLGNGDWLAPTGDTRLTLITCWPNTKSTHRLIVVAKP